MRTHHVIFLFLLCLILSGCKHSVSETSKALGTILAEEQYSKSEDSNKDPNDLLKQKKGYELFESNMESFDFVTGAAVSRIIGSMYINCWLEYRYEIDGYSVFEKIMNNWDPITTPYDRKDNRPPEELSEDIFNSIEYGNYDKAYSLLEDYTKSFLEHHINYFLHNIYKTKINPQETLKSFKVCYQYVRNDPDVFYGIYDALDVYVRAVDYKDKIDVKETLDSYKQYYFNNFRPSNNQLQKYRRIVEELDSNS